MNNKHVNQLILQALAPHLNPAGCLTPILNPTDAMVERIYSAACHAYDAGEAKDYDTAMCCLNEIAHICTTYFQQEDGR